MTGLLEPYGGVLVDLLAPPDRVRQLREASRGWPSCELAARQISDLEHLLSGGYSPLRGYLGRTEAEAVCATAALPDGTPWPLPVTFDVPEALARSLSPGANVALRDAEGVMLAALEVSEIWTPDLEAQAKALFGTGDPSNPAVQALQARAGRPCLAGRLEGLQLPAHYDFAEFRETPRATRRALEEAGWTRTLVCPSRGPLHRADVEFLSEACRTRDAHLLLQPAAAPRGPGDPDYYTRMRSLRAVRAAFPQGLARLSLLPPVPGIGGGREAVARAIVARNCGATHLLLDPSLGGPEAAAALERAKVGVEPVPWRAAGKRDLSEAGVKWMLEEGRALPEGYTLPEVERELRHHHPPRHRHGFTVFLTGLSGAGKSTIANVLLARLLERGDRYVTLLDGDLVRKNLSSELGFSREHRDLNIRRIGFVASEITKHGGVAICSPIAPYEAVRREVREMIEAVGGFVLVHVSTPLEVCEQRDRKGLYAKARAGLLPSFTGISDPYEPPPRAEVVIDATSIPPEAAAERILEHLESKGFLKARG